MNLSKRSVCLVSSLVGCLLLQGCQSVKRTLGLERDPPDEFAVVPSTLPLDMPPTFYELPTPQPGKPRPQDVAAAEAEQAKVFGHKAHKSHSHRSRGEAALLELGGGSRRHEEIRPTLEKEANEEAQKKRNLVLETFGVKKPVGDIIDPYEEIKQLKEKDVPHPRIKVDRNDHPIEREALPAPSGVSEKASSFQDRKGVVSPSVSVR